MGEFLQIFFGQVQLWPAVGPLEPPEPSVSSMGQLQPLLTGADPAPLGVAAALGTCKCYNTAFPNLVICQSLRLWNLCIDRAPVTDFF